MAGERVVIVDRSSDDLRTEETLLGAAGIELVVPPLGDAVLEAAAGADGVMVHLLALTADFIDGLERCRVILRFGVGVDNVDLAAATARGIVVGAVPGYGTTEVADHAMALLLGLARRIVVLDRDVRAGIWDVHGSAGEMVRLGGRRLGIVGLGRIGRATATRAQAFGLEVVASDPYIDPATAPAGVRLVELDELLRSADALSIHCPLTPETRGMIGARELALVPPGTLVVNTARGGIVEETALADALRDGRVAAAGLDVFATEPLPADHPLRDLPNAILTPHAAFYSQQSYEELHRRGTQAVIDVLRGREPETVANPEVLGRLSLQPRERRSAALSD